MPKAVKQEGTVRNLPQPTPLSFGGYRRLLHALNPPRSAFLLTLSVHACAMRVTVVGLCVCVCVCVSVCVCVCVCLGWRVTQLGGDLSTPM